MLYQGPFSIAKNLPYTSLSITNKDAYKQAKHIINHFLASVLSPKHYRVGYEDDWKDKMIGNHDCVFIQKLHKHVLNIPCVSHHVLEVTSDTRVIVV